ncbi:MAG TPA: YncE family protein [Streptosporangiaceae bacterium]|nr:YncE family protein [Streptosporangiaceae bacterium]
MTEIDQLVDQTKQFMDDCEALLTPGPYRWATAQARLGDAIAEGRAPAIRTMRGLRMAMARPWRRGQWPGWVTPLAAAAAVTAVIAGTEAVVSVAGAPADSRGTVTTVGGHCPRPGPGHPLTAYVTDQGSATVTPIDVATNTALRPIEVGSAPLAVAVTPNCKTAFVADMEFAGNGSVVAIRTATNTTLKPVEVGQGSGAIAVTPDGRTAYVVSEYTDTVTPIRVATDTALKPVKVGVDPTAIAITPDGRTAYVTNMGIGSGQGTVTPIDLATNKALSPIKVGSGPWEVAVTRDGRTAYVVDHNSGQVTPINVATNTALPPLRVDPWPGPSAMTPDGSTFYVASSVDGQNALVPIRTATNTVLPPVRLGGLGDIGLAVTPDSKTLYVSDAHQGTLTPLRTATNTLLPPVKVGFGCYILGVAPDGRTAYAATSPADSSKPSEVFPVRTATNTLLPPIKIKAGSDPNAIAFATR